MKNFVRWPYPFPPLFAILALLITACHSPSSMVVSKMASPEAALAATGIFDCPITQPPDPPFIPASPWPAQPPDIDRYWFGDNGLWVALPLDGIWDQLLLGEKFLLWSEEFDVYEEERPELTVTARRLDGNPSSFHVSEATNAYHESIHWAMLIGVELASSGCWELTGQYKGHQLSFVLWVPSA